MDQFGNYELLVWWNGYLFNERSKRGSIIRRHPSLFLNRVFLSKLVIGREVTSSENNEEPTRRTMQNMEQKKNERDEYEMILYFNQLLYVSYVLSMICKINIH